MSNSNGVVYEVKRAIVVGAGSSSSTPKISCVVSGANCPSCLSAQLPNSKSHRLNPSFLIQLQPSRQECGEDSDAPCTEDEQLINILVDCGKTFRESALKVFAPLRVQSIHGLLLTHPHADAVLGLDDLREFSTPRCPMPVYVDAATEQYLRKTFNYLFPTPEAAAKRLWVASIDWKEMFAGSPQRQKGELLRGILDLELPLRHNAHSCRPAPKPGSEKIKSTWPVAVFQVWHGVDTVANAFVFPLPQYSDDACRSARRCNVLVYLSDVSEVTDATLQSLREQIDALHKHIRRGHSDEAPSDIVAGHDEEMASLSDTDFLKRFIQVAIVDMLAEDRYVSHLNVREAVHAANCIGAAQTYFVGMSHSLFYDNMAQRIDEVGGNSGRMQLAWDGCVVFNRDS